MKHALKMLLRSVYARIVYHTGLAVLLDRLMPRRLTILAGHCVTDAEVNGGLPADMKIGAERLERLLRTLGRRHDLVTVGEGVERLERASGRSMVALSMDDGYRDNRTALLPILERVGAPATVFLITRPLEERAVGWSQKYFWLLDGRMSAADLARAYAARCADGGTRERVEGVLLAQGGDLAYAFKRVLKYDAARDDRDETLDALFREAGGDEHALCERIHLAWEDVRALADAGVELGGHTRGHEVLARLRSSEARAEIGEGRALLVRELGEAAGRTFAYPYGRRWDFDAESAAAVEECGFAAAVTTHAGTNEAGADRYRLARWVIDDTTPLHLLVVEACGGFALLRRLGLDLSE